MIPHPRRVFSCHGDGAEALRHGRLVRGMVPVVHVTDDFVVREADIHLCVIDDWVCHRRFWEAGGPSRLFRIAPSTRANECAGLGSNVCIQPDAREPHGIPKDEPKRARCLPWIHRIEAAIAEVEGLSVRLLRVSANGCGLMFADMEVRHVNGGRATMRLEFAWHHRVYVSVSWMTPLPRGAAEIVERMVTLAIGDGMGEDRDV